LIALAFLFVMAAALAVVFYTQKDDAIAGREKDRTTWLKVSTFEQAQKADTKEGRPYLETLEGQVKDLSKVVTGIETSYADATKKAEEAKKSFPNSGEGFTQLVAEAQAKAKTLQDQLTHAQADLKAAQDARDAAVANQAAQLEAFKKEEDSLSAKIKDGLAEREKLQQATDAQVKGIKDENQKTVEGLNKQIEQLNNKSLALTEKNRLLDLKVLKMIQDFRDASHPIIEIDRLAKMPKGKIVEVVDQLAYIDKGAKDHVVPGMTFSVFSPGGLATDAKPKATLTVVTVHPFTSECKIKDMKVANPVSSGDAIQNVAYDAQRVYTFMVMGDFDLHQSGKATHQGQEEVKDMIQRSGGKITDELTVRTDFLVMGDEPTKPPALGAEHTASDEELFNAQMKTYEEFDKAKRKASELYIPILNANRFLALMGYTPDKEK
jgi:hypothetical protein